MSESELAPLDQEWYVRYSKFGAMQSYEYLHGDPTTRAQEKEDFLEGRNRNPTLDYPKIDLNDISSKEKELLELKMDIISREPNEVLVQVYRWRINEKIAELRMLKATAHGDMRRFKRYSDFIYGKPSPEIFAFTIVSMRQKVEESLMSDNNDLREAAHAVLECLPNIREKNGEYELPDKETIEVAYAGSKDVIGVKPESSEDEELNAEAIKIAFEEALGEISAHDWEVTIVDGRSAVSVDQELKQVKVPSSKLVTRLQLRKLIAHEIKTHLQRRLHGERSKLMLLGLGLDRYSRGEEGVATMREQVLTGDVADFAGLYGHLAVGLASGLDDIPRDFRDVYEILEKYYTFTNMTKGQTLEAAQLNAKNSAWDRCVRTFRGTDCSTPGICGTKDMIYREGNIDVWEVIKSNPSEMIRFNVGKYDPSNDRHIWVLETLGISDDDLEEKSQ